MEFLKIKDRFEILDHIFMDIFKHLHGIDVKFESNIDNNKDCVFIFGDYEIRKIK